MMMKIVTSTTINNNYSRLLWCHGVLKGLPLKFYYDDTIKKKTRKLVKESAHIQIIGNGGMWLQLKQFLRTTKISTSKNESTYKIFYTLSTVPTTPNIDLIFLIQ